MLRKSSNKNEEIPPQGGFIRRSRALYVNQRESRNMCDIKNRQNFYSLDRNRNIPIRHENNENLDIIRLKSISEQSLNAPIYGKNQIKSDINNHDCVSPSTPNSTTPTTPTTPVTPVTPITPVTPVTPNTSGTYTSTTPITPIITSNNNENVNNEYIGNMNENQMNLKLGERTSSLFNINSEEMILLNQSLNGNKNSLSPSSALTSPNNTINMNKYFEPSQEMNELSEILPSASMKSTFIYQSNSINSSSSQKSSGAMLPVVSDSRIIGKGDIIPNDSTFLIIKNDSISKKNENKEFNENHEKQQQINNGSLNNKVVNNEIMINETQNINNNSTYNEKTLCFSQNGITPTENSLNNSNISSNIDNLSNNNLIQTSYKMNKDRDIFIIGDLSNIEKDEHYMDQNDLRINTQENIINSKNIDIPLRSSSSITNNNEIINNNIGNSIVTSNSIKNKDIETNSEFFDSIYQEYLNRIKKEELISNDEESTNDQNINTSKGISTKNEINNNESSFEKSNNLSQNKNNLNNKSEMENESTSLEKSKTLGLNNIYSINRGISIIDFDKDTKENFFSGLLYTHSSIDDNVNNDDLFSSFNLKKNDNENDNSQNGNMEEKNNNNNKNININNEDKTNKLEDIGNMKNQENNNSNVDIEKEKYINNTNNNDLNSTDNKQHENSIKKSKSKINTNYSENILKLKNIKLNKTQNSIDNLIIRGKSCVTSPEQIKNSNDSEKTKNEIFKNEDYIPNNSEVRKIIDRSLSSPDSDNSQFFWTPDSIAKLELHPKEYQRYLNRTSSLPEKLLGTAPVRKRSFAESAYVITRDNLSNSINGKPVIDPHNYARYRRSRVIWEHYNNSYLQHRSMSWSSHAIVRAKTIGSCTIKDPDTIRSSTNDSISKDNSISRRTSSMLKNSMLIDSSGNKEKDNITKSELSPVNRSKTSDGNLSKKKMSEYIIPSIQSLKKDNEKLDKLVSKMNYSRRESLIPGEISNLIIDEKQDSDDKITTDLTKSQSFKDSIKNKEEIVESEIFSTSLPQSSELNENQNLSYITKKGSLPLSNELKSIFPENLSSLEIPSVNESIKDTINNKSMLSNYEDVKENQESLLSTELITSFEGQQGDELDIKKIEILESEKRRLVEENEAWLLSEHLDSEAESDEETIDDNEKDVNKTNEKTVKFDSQLVDEISKTDDDEEDENDKKVTIYGPRSSSLDFTKSVYEYMKDEELEQIVEDTRKSKRSGWAVWWSNFANKDDSSKINNKKKNKEKSNKKLLKKIKRYSSRKSKSKNSKTKKNESEKTKEKSRLSNSEIQSLESDNESISKTSESTVNKCETQSMEKFETNETKLSKPKRSSSLSSLKNYLENKQKSKKDKNLTSLNDNDQKQQQLDNEVLYDSNITDNKEPNKQSDKEKEEKDKAQKFELNQIIMNANRKLSLPMNNMNNMGLENKENVEPSNIQLNQESLNNDKQEYEYMDYPQTMIQQQQQPSSYQPIIQKQQLSQTQQQHSLPPLQTSTQSQPLPQNLQSPLPPPQQPLPPPPTQKLQQQTLNQINNQNNQINITQQSYPQENLEISSHSLNQREQVEKENYYVNSQMEESNIHQQYQISQDERVPTSYSDYTSYTTTPNNFETSQQQQQQPNYEYSHQQEYHISSPTYEFSQQHIPVYSPQSPHSQQSPHSPHSPHTLNSPHSSNSQPSPPTNTYYSSQPQNEQEININGDSQNQQYMLQIQYQQVQLQLELRLKQLTQETEKQENEQIQMNYPINNNNINNNTPTTGILSDQERELQQQQFKNLENHYIQIKNLQQQQRELQEKQKELQIKQEKIQNQELQNHQLQLHQIQMQLKEKLIQQEQQQAYQYYLQQQQQQFQQQQQQQQFQQQQQHYYDVNNGNTNNVNNQIRNYDNNDIYQQINESDEDYSTDDSSIYSDHSSISESSECSDYSNYSSEFESDVNSDDSSIGGQYNYSSGSEYSGKIRRKRSRPYIYRPEDDEPYRRFNPIVERALYQLSFYKLSNCKRIQHQVVIRNLMIYYYDLNVKDSNCNIRKLVPKLESGFRKKSRKHRKNKSKKRSHKSKRTNRSEKKMSIGHNK